MVAHTPRAPVAGCDPLAQLGGPAGETSMHSIFARALSIGLLALLAQSAHAQTVADFYRGKSVDLYIGTSVGGGYDAYGRMLARHIGKYLPGSPTIVPKNMEGGGGLPLPQYFAPPGAHARPRPVKRLGEPPAAPPPPTFPPC